MNLRTVALLFGQAGVLLAALTVCGYPVARLVRHITHSRHITGLVALPLLGIYPLVQSAWIWSMFFETGMAVTFPVIVGVFAIISVMLWLTEGFHGSPSDRIQAFRHSRTVRAVFGIFVALAAVHLVAYSAYLDLPYVTPASLKNYDLPHFAVLSEHLRHGGFDTASNVYGTSLSRYLYEDVDGVFFVNLLPATLLGRPVWTTIASTLFVGWFLLGWQLWLLVRRVARVRPGIAGVSTVAGVASPLSFYVVGNGYLSQLYGGALVLAGCAVLWAVRNRRGELVSAIVVLGLISATLWHMYPFAALVIPVLGLGFRFFSQRPTVSIRQLRFLVPVIGVALAVSAVLANGRFPQAIRQVVAQSGAEAGWTLPALSPQELLGFTSSFTELPSDRWLGAIPVVFALAVAAYLLRRVPATARLGAMLVVAFGSYAAIYIRSGVSYQQWKWASLVAPLAVATFVALMGTAAMTAVRRTRLPASRVFGVGMATVLLAVYVVNVERLSSRTLRLDNASTYVTPDLAALASNRFLEDQSALALRVGPWDEMWITSFFPKTKMYEFSFWGYYPVFRVADDVWMLEKKNDATPPRQVVDEREVVGEYRAVKRTAERPATIEVVDHTDVVVPGGEVQWRVRVTNIGSEAWISPAVDSNSGVSLNVAQVGSTYAMSESVQRIALPAAQRVEPGQAYVFEGSYGVSDDYEFALQFDLYSPATGPFEIWSTSALARVTVDT